MTSILTDDFIRCFRQLPIRIQNQARKSYKLWKANPHHSSLDFKRVGQTKPIYSVRVGIGWRALGKREEDKIIWFWIGSHADYNKFLRQT